MSIEEEKAEVKTGDSLRSVVVKKHKAKTTTMVIKGYDNEGLKTINQYSFLQVLGDGAFAKVKLCRRNDTGEYFVRAQ